MDETIKVHVVKYASCANLMMRYRDPITGNVALNGVPVEVVPA